MRILHRYLGGDFLLAFVLTLVVFTFVMSIGVVFKVTDLLARGVSWQPVFQVLLSGIPAALMFSIPVSVLTACLLMFGRLSADGEITAMRVSGVSAWSIASRPLLVALLLTVLCIYINNDLAPRSHFARRLLVSRLGVESPLELLDEGRFINDFAGLTIYLGRREGDRVRNVRIYDERGGVRREIRAGTGSIRVSTNRMDLVFDLRDVRVDPFSADRPGPAFCERWTTRVPNALRSRTYRKHADDMSFGELLVGMRHTRAAFPELEPGDVRAERMALAVECNKRLALSAACLAFVLIGVPLGIKAHRKESSIGVAMSLGLVFNFYLFIIVAESLARQPALRPDLIVWLPVLISVGLGSWLMQRTN
ncbi:MAG: LptF/LptG family permease [Lentisphaerae bacterium]|nr:LptF/LptG family permease [Lentisphaerota bacterium]